MSAAAGMPIEQQLRRSLRDRLPLGSAGLTVSPVCIGMVRDPRVVPEAFDRGVNFFFVSADMHWPLYEATRRGLRELFEARRSARDEVVVAAVSYVEKPEFAVVPFLEVLDALPSLKRIDVTIAGGMKGGEGHRLLALQNHRGGAVPGVRASGVTFHERDAAVDVISGGEIDIGFIRYNTNHTGAELDVFPKLAPTRRTLLFNFKSTLGFVPHEAIERMPIDAQAWRPTRPDHYRFVLSRPEFEGILCSPLTVPELDALVQSFAAGPLTSEEITYIRTLTGLHTGKLRLKPRVIIANSSAPSA